MKYEKVAASTYLFTFTELAAVVLLYQKALSHKGISVTVIDDQSFQAHIHPLQLPLVLWRLRGVAEGQGMTTSEAKLYVKQRLEENVTVPAGSYERLYEMEVPV